MYLVTHTFSAVGTSCPAAGPKELGTLVIFVVSFLIRG